MQFGIADAKARLSELTSLVDAGQEVVIAKHGRPSYKLVSISSSSGKALAPRNLGDLGEFCARIRTLSKHTPEADGFVADWRKSDRY
jgi:prevent-host-death family protein